MHYLSFKKITKGLLIWGCLATTFSTYAKWEGNGLLGVGRELAERKGHLTAVMDYTAVPNFPNTDLWQEHTDRGYVWDIFGGYQFKYKSWILGGEIDFKWDDISEEQNFAFSDVGRVLGWMATVRYESKPTIGITGRLAYEMAPYFISYIRLGVERSKDKLTTTYTLNPALGSFSLFLEESQWKNHFIGGFGVEIPLPKITSLALRLEYDYHSYFTDKGLTTHGIGQLTGVDPAFTNETHPIMQSGKAALVWNFA